MASPKTAIVAQNERERYNAKRQRLQRNGAGQAQNENSEETRRRKGREKETMTSGFPELEDRPTVPYTRPKYAMPPQQLRKRDVFWMCVFGTIVGWGGLWVLMAIAIVVGRVASM